MNYSRNGAALLATLLAFAGTSGNAVRIDEVRTSQWFIGSLRLTAAHEISTGTGITVGLPDSGVSQHTDLRGNLLVGVDLTGNSEEKRQTDEDGHGTNMAGLIASHGHGTDQGSLGVAPSAQILPIRTSSITQGEADLGEGIAWAANNGAEVINVSAATAQSRSLANALAAARRVDAVVIAGLGNRTRNTLPGYPAASPGVLAVGASDELGEHAEFSVTDAVAEICAPGVNMTTTGLNDGYRKVGGTSAAAAVVSGAAALVRSRFPGLSAPEVVHRLTYTARDIGAPGRDDECGFGVVDIVAALTAEVPPLGAPADSGVSPASSSGSSVDNGSVKGGHGSVEGERARGEASSRLLMAVVLGGGGVIVAIGAVVVFLALRRRRVEH